MSITGIVFLLLFLAGLGLALFRQPIYGLYVYVAVFYLDPVNRWWGSTLPDLRWSFTAALVTLIATFVRSSRVSRVPMFSNAPIVLFFIYVGWMFLRTPWAVDPDEHWLHMTIYAKYLLVIYLVYSLVDSRQHLTGFLLVHSMGCFYLGVLAWSVGTGSERLDGVGGPSINDSNSMAMQFATGVYAAAAYYFAASGKGWRRLLVVPAVPFALNGLVLSGSRGGFLAVLAGGAVLFFTRPTRQLRVVLPYAILGVLLLGYVASTNFVTRMSGLAKPVAEQADADLSVETRVVLFKTQWRMALDHPFGVGNGGTAALSYTYLDPIYWATEGGVKSGRASHNSIMSALVDQGFPGVVVWLAIIFTLVSRIRSNKRWCDQYGDLEAGWLNAGLAAMFAVIVAAGMFSPQQRTEVYVWTLALLCAFAHIIRAGPMPAPVRRTVTLRAEVADEAGH
jgi:hypothetical protein